MITIERYRKTRFWAVYDGDELVCVTVYKKGAKHGEGTAGDETSQSRTN